MEEKLVNKVEESGLLQFDLEELRHPGERRLFDIKEWLYEGIVLREKGFRENLKSHDWSAYRGQLVAITCSADAIVPTWAFMLVAANLHPFAEKTVFGDLQKLEEVLYEEKIAALKPEDFRDQRVVIKGCGSVPVSAYVRFTEFLRPVAKSIMYGEPCSTVPVYKAGGRKQ